MLPKSIVSDKEPVVMQMEFETEFGTIVQCSDMIVQRLVPFHPMKCSPACKNGGVCNNGECICSKMFSGDQCETKIKSSSSMSTLLIILIIITLLASFFIMKETMKLNDQT